MAKGCINGVLDETKYSSPVPFIGLYIAAGSAVCMLFMLFDIVSAFRRRKTRWMPCRIFSLNSLTLTLLAISSKIPVDLTTPMPSVYDQLSKLTGTTLICVSIGFFYPSLADQSDSELLTNIISLIVFVITVVVNICIQISTGVIYLFITEHIIIMVCMCLLLILLWWTTPYLFNDTEILLDRSKDQMIKGDGSLLQKLKSCYLYGFDSNPQLTTFRDPPLQIAILFCSIPFGALLQAAFRSIIMKQLKNCQAKSDYKWSTGIIVPLQILTILIGIFAISFRWFNYSIDMGNNIPWKGEEDDIIRENPILGVSSWDMFHFFLRKVFVITLWTMYLVCLPFYSLSKCTFRVCYNWRDKRDGKVILTEFQDEKAIARWIAYKASNDMKRWMEVSRRKGVDNLYKLFSRTSPSPELCKQRSLNDLYPNAEMGIEVSSLSIALLVKIAAILLPSNLSKSLECSFSEAYAIIDFIETRIKLATYEAKTKTRFAKAVLLGDGFGVLLPEQTVEFQSQPQLNGARIILQELKNKLPPDSIAEEVGTIIRLIDSEDHQTLQDLYNYIVQMFVDMMHLFLVQFPIVIYGEVTASSAKDFQKRVECALKLLWRIELLENQVDWLFPKGSSISSLVISAVPATSVDEVQGVSMDVSTPTEGIQLQPYGIPASFPNDDQDVSMDISTPTEGIQLQPYGVPVAPPDDAQGVSMDVSTPTEVIELQPCARFSDPPNDPLAVAQEAPSAIEDAATPLTEIVVIQDELSTTP